MPEFSSLGKWLMVAGLLFLAAGAFVLAAGKIPFLGRLPGDVRVERPGFSLYFPLTTCLLLSVLVSAVLWLFSRFK